MKAQNIFTKKFIATLIWLGTMLIAMNAMAQVTPPPVRSSVDENGVDLFSLDPVVSSTDVSIGPEDGTGLSFSHALYPGSMPGLWWTNNLAITVSGSSSSPIVSVGGSSESFTLSGGTYVPDGPTGSSLQLISGQYVYKRRDGTTINFLNTAGKNYVNAAYSGLLAVGATISAPNGLVTTFTYKNDSYTYCTFPWGADCYQYSTIYYIRLSSVNNSLGYQLKLSYQSNDPGNGSWGYIDKVTAVNNAIEYCDPSADACSLSQPWNYVQYTLTATIAGSLTTYVTKWLDSIGNGMVYTTMQNPSTGSESLGIRRNGHSSDDILYTMSVAGGTSGPVTKVTKAAQYWTYTQSTDSSSNPVVRTVTDPLLHTRTYHFSSYALLGEYDDELSHATIYNYNNPTTIGNLNTITLPGTDVITYGYDSRYNVSSITRSAKTGYTGAISTSATYPATCVYLVSCNKPSTTTDERGKVTTYHYADTTTGALTQVIAPADVSGNHPTTTYGYSSSYAWTKNSSGALVASSGPVSLLTTISTCQTNPSCASGSSDEARTTIAYEAGSSGAKSNLLPVSISAGSGANPAMAVTSLGSDAFANLTSVGFPLVSSAATTRAYFNASRQRVGSVTPDPDGTGALKPRASRITYRSDGQVDHVDVGTVTNPTDSPSGLTVLQTVTTSYDSYNRPVRQSLSAGGSTFVVSDTAYDALGRPTCSAQRMNLASLPSDGCTPGTAGGDGPDRITNTVYNFDSSVQKVQTGYGVSVRDLVVYTYDVNGNVTTIADAKGNLTTIDYDRYDRPVKTHFPNPSGGGSSSSDYQEAVLDDAGNVTSLHLRGYASDGTKHIDYTYDDIGRVTSKTLPSPETGATYSYDLLGRPLTVYNGVTLTYAYDALSNTLTESQPFGSLSYQYDTGGRRTRVTWPDGFYAAYEYDLLNEVTAIRENGATSGAGVLALYGYDDLGRRTSLVRGNGTSTSYGYDGASRLISLSHDLSGTAYDLSLGFSYNSAGQSTSTTRSNDVYAWSGATNVVRPYNANGLNQYTSAGSTSFTYDARGNLTGDGTNSFTYGSENQMKTTASGLSFFYDGLGRLTEYDTSSTTRFVYDGGQIASEVAYSGALLRRYVLAPGDDEPIVWYEGSGTSDRRWLHADERGSVIAISNASGAPTGINSYDEFGIPGPTNVGRFQYTGQAWLGELGQYYFKARMYSPTLGRFMQTDPLGYRNGPNWYNYVHGDPINSRDPSGLCSPNVREWVINIYDNYGNLLGSDTKPGDVTWGFDIDPNSFLDCFAELPPEPYGGFGGAGSGDGGNGAANQPPKDPLCNAVGAVEFVKEHESDAAVVAKSLNLNTEMILGLTAEESQWGTGRISMVANNYISQHAGSKPLPMQIGIEKATGDGPMVKYASYLASAQAFAIMYGNAVRGINDPDAFANALVKAHFNSGSSKNGGRDDFAKYTADIIRATARRMKC